ncbi:MAG: hypothetical protein JRG92_16820 [Deltaproteobacteria bacterium]|nr:hypothetical protein [Deltaproteobacteria bacterium]
MLNVETVVNAQTATIINDGQNGLPAVLETCGPDDLLDFVNPSSQVIDLGLGFPPAADDNDQDVYACTRYTLNVGDTYVQLDTEIFNDELTPLPMIVGDWMNAGGELDMYGRPNEGVGAALLAPLGALAFTGYAEGIDYHYTTTPSVGATNYVTISGVTVILHHTDMLTLLFTGLTDFIVPAGGSAHTVRYFGVGDGSSSNAVDLENAVKGNVTATIEGLVTVGGVPAAGAHVSVGTLDDTGRIKELVTRLTTDEAGRFSGTAVIANPVVNYGVVAGLSGALYENGALEPPVRIIALDVPDEVVSVDFLLPESGRIQVNVTDQAGAVPARVTLVGFDPSPEPIIPGPSFPGLGGGDLGLFNDVSDIHPFGVAAVAYADAEGEVTFEVEPGDYQLYVSRGPEYSLFETPVTVTGGQTTAVVAQIARVLDTPGFVSGDFHVHGINSADSRVSHRRRVLGYAADGIDNLVMTDHHVHTDLGPTIAELGLSRFVGSTVGEEITTFDYGHYNAYPLRVDPSRPSKGSTDWAVAAPPGQDFPNPDTGSPSFNATPAELADLATQGANSLPDSTIQVNHIGSHFNPLQIDTGVDPIQDDLDATERLQRRLDPAAGNLFHPFPAMELWNGDSRGAQSEFLDQRIGIWMNLLSAGYSTTAIADTDSHKFNSLRSAGAATWTAASPGADAPDTFDSAEVARSVTAGKAVGGQGLYVQARLRATDGSGDIADLTAAGKTSMTDASGHVTLEIDVQAPLWAEYDTIEIYANATTTRVLQSYNYTATPTLTLVSAADFAVNEVVVDSGVDGASRWTTTHSENFVGLTEDTWFIVVVKGTDGVSRPMFPVYASDLDAGMNTTLADLTDGNLDQGGVMALGFTNALYFQAPLP